MTKEYGLPPSRQKTPGSSGQPPCPGCGHTLGATIDSRIIEGSANVRRRKVCSNCALRFTTFEITEDRMHELQAAEERVKDLHRILGDWARK